MRFLPVRGVLAAIHSTSSSIVSDDDLHKLPASRDERADGGHGSDVRESSLDSVCSAECRPGDEGAAYLHTAIYFSDLVSTRNGRSQTWCEVRGAGGA